MKQGDIMRYRGGVFYHLEDRVGQWVTVLDPQYRRSSEETLVTVMFEDGYEDDVYAQELIPFELTSE